MKYVLWNMKINKLSEKNNILQKKLYLIQGSNVYNVQVFVAL